ncbi:MAG: 50S ribosomal protein L30 [Candidatus Aenigmarchaeota archaeon ex4484_56]|nr:MAG: 50S ribosomal protein L30 [Candidatus Aenigmarchaeota archaeon ex4484_56]
MIAAIRLRGKFNVRKEIEDTLGLLGLKRKNTCVVLEDNKYNLGMLKKAKDYITYGEIDEEILGKLLEKKKPIKQTDKKIIFRLPNPKRGFKSIKKGYNQGGDLGYRGKKINELVERIIKNIN